MSSRMLAAFAQRRCAVAFRGQVLGSKSKNGLGCVYTQYSGAIPINASSLEMADVLLDNSGVRQSRSARPL